MVASRPIVPQDVGIQTPFSTIGNVLVAGPNTSQIKDGGILPSFVFNVRSYGAVGDNVANDTAAFSAAILAAYTAWNNNTAQPQIVYIPRGVYKITSAIVPNSINGGLINGFVSFIGDGGMNSLLNVSASFTGDLFPFSNIWQVGPGGNVFPAGGTGAILSSGLRCNVHIRGLGVIGDRTSATMGNLFAFYDAADFVEMSDIFVQYWPGRVIWGGIMNQSTTACLRESIFSNLRFFNCGNTSAPVIEIDSNGTGATTPSNELAFRDIDIYAPYGDGISVHSSNNTTTNIRFVRIRVEGREPGFGALPGDLFRIGNTTDLTNVTNIHMSKMLLLNPQVSHYALNIIKGSGSALNPFNIFFQGSVSGVSGTGAGIQILAGRYMQFYPWISTAGTGVTIGPSSGGVQSNLFFQDGGANSPWTWNVDSTSISAVVTASNNSARHAGIPAGGTTGLGLVMSTTNNFGIFFGSGVPTLSAAQGSLYLRSDGNSTSTRLYVNTNGTTTWTAVTTVA